MKNNASVCLPTLLPSTGDVLMGLVITVLVMLAISAPADDERPSGGFGAERTSVPAVGMEIRNNQDRSLGQVQDFVVDLENGRLVEILVSSGGFLGFWERIVSVPPSAFTGELAGRTLRLDVDQAKWKSAPVFRMSKAVGHSQSVRVAKVYRYYGFEPYFAVDGEEMAIGDMDAEPLGYIQCATKLLGLKVKNLQNESFGKVNTFMFDPLRGKVTHVIVLAPGNFMTKSIIPATALRFSSKHNALYLDMSKKEYENEPRFRWTYNQFVVAAINDGDFKQESSSDTNAPPAP